MVGEAGGGAGGGGLSWWASRVVDPGVLCVRAGCGLIASALLIPALEDLRLAERERDAARAVASWQAERLERHAAWIDDLRSPDETALRGLAADQLNLMPAGSRAVLVRGEPGSGPADVLAEVEPAFEMPAGRVGVDSLLSRMALDGRGRVLVFGCGAILVLFGLAGAEPRRG